MEKYAPELFNVLVELMKKGISLKNEPLIEESLNLVSIIAQIIEEKFSQYYNPFMPILIDMLKQTPAGTP